MVDNHVALLANIMVATGVVAKLRYWAQCNFERPTFVLCLPPLAFLDGAVVMVGLHYVTVTQKKKILVH